MMGILSFVFSLICLIVAIIFVVMCIGVIVDRNNTRIIGVTWKVLIPDMPPPYRATEHSAGFDFHAPFDIEIPPKSSMIVPLGICWAPTVDNCVLILKSRSGLARNGITALNAGVIDSDYRGEINVLLDNDTTEPYEVKQFDRIVQGIVVPLHKQVLCRTIYPDDEEELPDSERGTGGFGSTGR